jgi:hypothetical protein
MNALLRDIVYDLREKRLWPVAAVLAVAVLAVPVTMLKSSEPQSAQPARAAPPATKALKIAQLVKDPAKAFSELDSFDSKDPFKPGVKPLKKLESVLIAGGNDFAKSPAGAGAGADPTKAGSGTGSAGGTGSGEIPTPTSPTAPKRSVSYTYVADVTFGLFGKTRAYNGLKKLEMLPNDENPLLVFLGATTTGDEAAFLVDQSLEQTGEGNCADTACSVLSLGAGSEHRFTDEQGNDYLLRVNEIRKTRVAKAASAGKSTKASRSGRSAKARAGVPVTSAEKDAAALAFVSSLLVDVQTLTSTDAGGSSSGRQGR